MDRQFLEGYALEDAQIAEILSEVRKEVTRAHLSARLVRSVSAAEGILAEQDMSDLTPEASVEKLFSEHPYLFEGQAVQFTGPAGGESDDPEAERLRRALGL